MILMLSFLIASLALITAIFSNSPLVTALSVILYATGLSFFLGEVYSSWLMVSLMMIFLGGMMVIFLYICSLASNKKFVVSVPTKMEMVLLIFFLSISLVHSNSGFWGFMKFNFMATNFSLNLSLIVFLIFTLLVVVKLSESFKGALGLKFF